MIPILLQQRGAYAPTSLFTGGEQGFIWDSYESGVYLQERTGAAATTPASVTTNPVGSVRDLSGNGNWFTAPTADTKRPLFVVSGALKALRFDSTDDELSCATAALFAALDDKDFYVGVAASNIGAGERNLFATRADMVVGIPNSQGDLMSLRYSTYFNAGASQTASVAGAHVWTWNAAAASMSCYRDGVQQGTAVAITGSQAGSQAFVGSRGGSLFCGIDIHRIVVINRALTASERANQDTWLGTGAGLTL